MKESLETERLKIQTEHDDMEQESSERITAREKPYRRHED